MAASEITGDLSQAWSMAYLKVFSKGLLHIQIPLDPGAVCTVGSSPASRVVLQGADVAAEHCRFRAEAETWWVEDMGSEAGTLFNGARLTEPQMLAPRDQVQVGDFILVVGALGNPAGTPALSLEAMDETPGYTEDRDPHGFPIYSNQGREEVPAPPKEKILVLVLEGVRPSAVTLDKELTLIGSGAHCDLRIDGLFVRREQAVILKDATGCRIIGQGGLRNLRVNGERVVESYLVPGDEITLAGHRLSLRQL